jgi:hypothetical protein
MTIEYVWRPNTAINELQYPNTNFADKLALMSDPRFGNVVPVTVLGSDSQEEDEVARFTDLNSIRNSRDSQAFKV